MARKKTKQASGPAKTFLGSAGIFFAPFIIGILMLLYQLFMMVVFGALDISIHSVIPTLIVVTLPFVVFVAVLVTVLLKSEKKRLEIIWKVSFWLSIILITLMTIYILGEISPMLIWALNLFTFGALGNTILIGAGLAIITVCLSGIGLVMLISHKKTVERRHILTLIAGIIACIAFVPVTYNNIFHRDTNAQDSSRYQIDEPETASEWLYKHHDEYSDVWASIRDCHVEKVAIKSKTINNTSTEYIEVRIKAKNTHDPYTGLRTTVIDAYILPLYNKERLAKSLKMDGKKNCGRAVSIVDES